MMWTWRGGRLLRQARHVAPNDEERVKRAEARGDGGPE
jgi:hypothetical protein